MREPTPDGSLKADAPQAGHRVAFSECSKAPAAIVLHGTTGAGIGAENFAYGEEQLFWAERFLAGQTMDMKVEVETCQTHLQRSANETR